MMKFWFPSLLLLSVTIEAALLPNDTIPTILCPFCTDPTFVPQSNFSVFTSGDNVFSCQDAFELGPLRLPEENCTFWQNRGATICECAAKPRPENNCTLCEDGSKLPMPALAGAPGKLCAQLQVDAKRDEPENCIVWQQTVGVYCGCGNPQAVSPGQEVCRICGGSDNLPDPLLEIPLVGDNGQELSSSCGELEFEANLLGANCDQYQILYGAECCRDAVTQEEEDEDSSFLYDTFLPGVISATLMLIIGQ